MTAAKNPEISTELTIHTTAEEFVKYFPYLEEVNHYPIS